MLLRRVKLCKLTHIGSECDLGHYSKTWSGLVVLERWGSGWSSPFTHTKYGLVSPEKEL